LWNIAIILTGSESQIKDFYDKFKLEISMSLGHTKEERINTVFEGGGHVVILGAGASVATTLRNLLLNGMKLPLLLLQQRALYLSACRGIILSLFFNSFKVHYSKIAPLLHLLHLEPNAM
jgi:hypothetical protein